MTFEEFKLYGTIAAVVVVIVSLIVIYYRYKYRCRSCGKWYGLKEINKTLIDQRSSHKTKELVHKDGKGKVIAREQVVVPATTYTYHIDLLCKHCQAPYSWEETETVEN